MWTPCRRQWSANMVKRPGRIPKWGTTGKPANRSDQMHHLQDG